MIPNIHQVWLGDGDIPAAVYETQEWAKKYKAEHYIWSLDELQRTFGTFGFFETKNAAHTKDYYRFIAKFYSWCIMTQGNAMCISIDYVPTFNLTDLDTKVDFYVGGTPAKQNSDVLYAQTREAAVACAGHVYDYWRYRASDADMIISKDKNPLGIEFLRAYAYSIFNFEGYSYGFVEDPHIVVKSEGEGTRLAHANRLADHFTSNADTLRIQVVDTSIYLPNDTKRIFIVSEEGFQLPNHIFDINDCIIHINKAVHINSMKFCPAKSHLLFVEMFPMRHRNVPADLREFEHIHFYKPSSLGSWTKDYRNKYNSMPGFTVTLASDYRSVFGDIPVTIFQDVMTDNDREWCADNNITISKPERDIMFLMETSNENRISRTHQRDSWLDTTRFKSSYYYLYYTSDHVTDRDILQVPAAMALKNDKVIYALQQALNFDWKWLYIGTDHTFANPDRVYKLLSEKVFAVLTDKRVPVLLSRRIVEGIIENKTYFSKTLFSFQELLVQFIDDNKIQIYYTDKIVTELGNLSCSSENNIAASEISDTATMMTRIEQCYDSNS